MTLLPNDNFFKDGYQIALENAKGLSKIADKSSEENQFGIALSLKILAAEEATKAIAFIMIHSNKNVDLTGFAKIFKDHKTKHEFLSEGSIFIEAFVDMGSTKYGALDYVFSVLEKLPGPHKAEIKKLETDFSNSLGWIRKVKNIEQRESVLKEWWAKANLEKNGGLYVDIIDGNWYNPKAISKEKYLEACNHTELQIENAEKLPAIFENLATKKNNKAANTALPYIGA